MIRKTMASLLGGLIIFIWGTISWAVLQWHLSSMAALPNGGEMTATLDQAGAASGVYFYPPTPDASDANAVQQWQEKYGGGSYISMLVYHDKGYTESMGSMFLTGFVLNVAGAGLVVFILCISGTREQSYLRRVGLIALLGIFASVVGPLAEWNYFGFPASFSIPIFLDGVISWSLAGLVIAAFLKPTAAATSGISKD